MINTRASTSLVFRVSLYLDKNNEWVYYLESLTLKHILRINPKLVQTSPLFLHSQIAVFGIAPLTIASHKSMSRIQIRFHSISIN